MASNIAEKTQLMLDIIDKIKDYKVSLENAKKLSSFQREKKVKEINSQLLLLLNELEKHNSDVYNAVLLESFLVSEGVAEAKPAPVKVIEIPLPEKETLKYLKLTKKDLAKLKEEINITNDEIKEFIKKNKKKKPEEIKPIYSIYKPSQLGKVANTFFEGLTFSLTKKYPELFKSLTNDIKKVNINMLTKTYISIMFLFTAISLPFFLILCFLVFGGFKSVLYALVGSILTFVLFYNYPSSLVNSRKKKIKNDLPFAIVHMSAVAGSGAKPIDIFNLLNQSGEYRELGKEINRILNYVNLFGYDLSTALKAVAQTTPSPEFKELLNGMVSTIETGGDLDEYLKGKAMGALNTYRLDRKRYVEALATYSDIYTTILVAAPLLFVVVLAIINAIGGKISGFEIADIAVYGTYGLIPLLNIGYMVFLSISQPEI